MDDSSQKTLTIETALYASLFALALVVRLLNLGAAPLSEYEARIAMQAYQLAQGQLVSPLTQPAYVVVTGLLFAFFKDSNTVARLFPALAGSSLVLLPLFFSNVARLSLWTRRAGLLLALGLALDPALVALSRLAGSPLIAMAGLLLAAGFAWRGRAGWTGLFTALALLSGPAWVQGLLGFALAALVTLILDRTKPEPAEPIPSLALLPADLKQARFWRTAALFAAGTLLLGGMLSLRLPQGLAGLADSLPAYLRGWLEPSGVPALRLPAGLVFYQPMALLFGVLSALRLWRSGQPLSGEARFLSLWALFALAVAMLYPARQVADAAWALVPLWALAVLEISRYSLSRLDPSLRLPSLGMVALVALFLGLIWYNLLRLDHLNAQPILYAAIVGGLGLMAVIVVILAALGWSWGVASLGLSWGLCLIAACYMLSAMWGMSQLRPGQPAELWSISPGAGQVAELSATLDEVSERSTGLTRSLDIRVTFDSPALQWALRHYLEAQFTSSLAVDEQPSVILSLPAQQDPALAASYRGQELVWSRLPAWSGVLPPKLLRWITYREAPTLPQTILLWVRADLFPGGAQTDAAVP